MIKFLDRQRNKYIYKLLSCLLIMCFSASMIVPPAYAQALLPLPAPGMMVPLSPAFNPLVIRGLKIYPDEPLHFGFIMDAGQTRYQDKALEDESSKLIKYFLTSLTIPDEDLWVNLSPYEKDKIIPGQFGATEMGRDLLAQDYLLKQITASLIYPEDELGKKFWERIYRQARERFGTSDIPVNTFNKVWVLPQKAVVYESGDTAFVVDSRLKVMLEEDYMAREAHLVKREAFGKQHDTLHESRFTKQIIREIIIPELEREVNRGENFAQLRQIYHSMILATWFKRNLKKSVLSKIYVGKNKIKGVDVQDKQIKEKIYQQYLEAFRKGVYNFIREDIDPDTNQVIPRKYFSGGFQFGASVGQTTQVIDISGNALGLVRAERSFGGSILFADAGVAQPDISRSFNESLVNRSMLVVTDVKYPGAGLNEADQLEAETVMVDLGLSRLSVRQWAQRDAQAFTGEEWQTLRAMDFNQFDMDADEIRSIRQSVYDRSSGDIEVFAVVENHEGEKFYYRLRGIDSTSMNKLKSAMPTVDDMKEQDAVLQISMGNQGDLSGNFMVLSNDSQGWDLFGATNDLYFDKQHRVLVEFKDGRRAVGFMRLKGDNSTNAVSHVYFRPGLEGTGEESELQASDVTFILAATALGWGKMDIAELLKGGYSQTVDLRHIFRFPFMDGSVFHGHLASEKHKLDSAFNGQPVDLPLTFHGSPLDLIRFRDVMTNINGYVEKYSKGDVKEPGDYFIEEETNTITVIFLQSRYPVNALVVSEDGQRTAVINIKGLSGRVGANYWTVYRWIQETVQEKFGWTPQAVFALDNGMDPYVRQFDSQGQDTVLVQGGRRHFNAMLLVDRKDDSLKTPSKAMLSDADIPVPQRLEEGAVFIPEAKTYWSADDAPVETYMEISQAAVDLGLSEAVLRRVIDAASHKNTEGAVLSGRSFIIPLGEDSFTFAGKRYTAIRLKAVTDAGGIPKMVKYEERDEDLTHQPNHKIEIEDGIYRLRPFLAHPTGTQFLEKALNEYRMMNTAVKAGIPTGLPLGVGEYVNMKMPVESGRGKRVGFTVMALTEGEHDRISLLVHHLGNAVREQDFRQIVTLRHLLEMNLEASINTLIDFHQKGFVHKNVHQGQFRVALLEQSEIFDLDTARHYDGLSRNEYIFWTIVDFLGFYRGVRLAISDYFDERERRLIQRLAPGVRSLNDFLVYYFKDEVDAVEAGRIERVATRTQLQDLTGLYSVYEFYDGKPLSEVLSALMSNDLGELLFEVAGRRYDKLTAGTNAAMLADDAREAARILMDAGYADDLRDFSSRAYAGEELEARTFLFSYPVEKLIQDFLQIDYGTVAFDETVVAMANSRSLYSFLKLKELYPTLKDTPQKQRALLDVFRVIQLHIILDDSQGDEAINRRTWGSRLDANIPVIDRMVDAMPQDEPVVIGDFAVSDGTSAYHLARHFLQQGRDVKVIGYDLRLNVHVYRSNGSIYTFTDSQGNFLQMTYDIPETGERVALGPQRLSAAEIARIEEAARSMEPESVLTLVNPEAEAFAGQHPGRLQFLEHNVFDPLDGQHHIIRVMGLLVRGDYSYFNDGQIKTALAQLGKTLVDGGVLINGTYWDGEGQYDVFTREGSLIRLTGTHNIRAEASWQAPVSLDEAAPDSGRQDNPNRAMLGLAQSNSIIQSIVAGDIRHAYSTMTSNPPFWTKRTFGVLREKLYLELRKKKYIEEGLDLFFVLVMNDEQFDKDVRGYAEFGRMHINEFTGRKQETIDARVRYYQGREPERVRSPNLQKVLDLYLDDALKTLAQNDNEKFLNVLLNIHGILNGEMAFEKEVNLQALQDEISSAGAMGYIDALNNILDEFRASGNIGELYKALLTLAAAASDNDEPRLVDEKASYIVARVIGVQSKKGTRPLSAAAYFKMLLRFNRHQLQGRHIAISNDNIRAIERILARTPDNEISQDAAMLAELEELKQQMIDIAKLYQIEERADFTTVVSMARAINPGFNVPLPEESISQLTLDEFHHLHIALLYDIFIPHGTYLQIAGFSPDFPVEVIYHNAEILRWGKIPYLNNGNYVWVADVRNDEEHTVSPVVSNDWFVFIDTEQVRRAGLEEYDRLKAMLESGQTGELNPFERLIPALFHSWGVALEVFGDLTVRSAYHSGVREAQDVAFVALNSGNVNRYRDRPEALRAHLLLKKDSSLRRILESEDVQQMGPEDRDQVLEQRGYAINTVAYRLGGLVDEIREYQLAEKPGLAVLALTRFLGEQLNIVSHVSDDMDLDQMAQANAAASIQNEFSRKLGNRPLFQYLQVNEAHKDTIADRALELVEAIYQEHFYTDEERLELIRTDIELPAPALNRAMLGKEESDPSRLTATATYSGRHTNTDVEFSGMIESLNARGRALRSFVEVGMGGQDKRKVAGAAPTLFEFYELLKSLEGKGSVPADFSLTGVDINEDVVEAAQAKIDLLGQDDAAILRNLSVRHGNFSALSDLGGVDVIRMFNVLQYYPDKQLPYIFDQVNRALNQGGLFAFGAWGMIIVLEKDHNKLVPVRVGITRNLEYNERTMMYNREGFWERYMRVGLPGGKESHIVAVFNALIAVQQYYLSAEGKIKDEDFVPILKDKLPADAAQGVQATQSGRFVSVSLAGSQPDVGPAASPAMLAKQWRAPELHDPDNFIMTAKFNGIDRLLGEPGQPSFIDFFSASVISHDYVHTFGRNDFKYIGLRLDFPDDSVIAVLRQFIAWIEAYDKSAEDLDAYLAKHRILHPDNLLLNRMGDLGRSVDMTPQDVIREIKSNYNPKFQRPNEVLLANGPQLRPTGILLLVKKDDKFDFIHTIRILKNNEDYRRVLPYARKHGLPFILIPEAGADVEQARQRIKEEFPDWIEVEGQPNVYWDSTGSPLATAETIRNRAMLHDQHVAIVEKRNTGIIERFNALEGVVKVVDFGTGGGEFLGLYRQQNPGHEIIGIDKSSLYDSFISLGQPIPEDMVFLVMDDMKTEISDASVDRVTFNFPPETMIQSYEYSDVIGEALRILKVGGELVILTPGNGVKTKGRTEFMDNLEADLSSTFATEVRFERLGDVEPDYPETHWMKELEEWGIYIAKITKTPESGFNRAMLARQQVLEEFGRIIDPFSPQRLARAFTEAGYDGPQPQQELDRMIVMNGWQHAIPGAEMGLEYYGKLYEVMRLIALTVPELDGLVDMRPVYNRFLSVPVVGFDMGVKRMVNPENKPLKGLYGAAAVDVSRFLLSTNATEGYFVDKDYTMKGRDTIGRGIDAVDHYRRYKYKGGWSASMVQGLENVTYFEALLTELELMGVSFDDIERIHQAYIGTFGEEKVTTIQFRWAYEGEEEKLRTIHFINGDITDPSTYEQHIPENMDFYYQRAAITVPFLHDRFLNRVAAKLREDAFMLIDPAAQNGDGEKVLLDPAEEIRKHVNVRRANSFETEFWSRILLTPQLGEGLLYGRTVNVYQLTPSRATDTSHRIIGTQDRTDSEVRKLADLTLDVGANQVTMLLADGQRVDLVHPDNYQLQDNGWGIDIYRQLLSAVRSAGSTPLRQRVAEWLDDVDVMIALRYAFREAAINSWRAIGRKDGTHQGKIYLTLEASDEEITISIKDDGIGLSHAARTRLFEQYSTKEPRELRRTGDAPFMVGLGLQMTRQRLGTVNGTVDIYDNEADLGEEESGATLVMKIPLFTSGDANRNRAMLAELLGEKRVKLAEVVLDVSGDEVSLFDNEGEKWKLAVIKNYSGWGAELFRELTSRLGPSEKVQQGLKDKLADPHVKKILKVSLSEVLINAWRAINRFEAGKQQGQIRISLEGSKSGVKIIIKDTGIGLSHIDRELMFRKYFTDKTDAELRRAGQNRHQVGKGLYAVHELLGDINATVAAFDNQTDLNEASSGATFVFDIPLQTAANQAMLAEPLEDIFADTLDPDKQTRAFNKLRGIYSKVSSTSIDADIPLGLLIDGEEITDIVPGRLVQYGFLDMLIRTRQFIQKNFKNGTVTINALHRLMDSYLLEYETNLSRGLPLPGSSEGLKAIIQHAMSISEITKGTFVKDEKLRFLLMRNPPQALMKEYRVDSVEALIERLGVRSAYSLARYVEAHDWGQKINQAVGRLQLEDFEQRPIEVIIYDDIPDKAKGYFKDKLPFSQDKIAGTLTGHPVEIDHENRIPILRALTRALHYLHELRFYSNVIRARIDGRLKDGRALGMAVSDSLDDNIDVTQFLEPHALVEALFMVQAVNDLESAESNEFPVELKGLPFTLILQDKEGLHVTSLIDRITALSKGKHSELHAKRNLRLNVLERYFDNIDTAEYVLTMWYLIPEMFIEMFRRGFQPYRLTPIDIGQRTAGYEELVKAYAGMMRSQRPGGANRAMLGGHTEELNLTFLFDYLGSDWDAGVLDFDSNGRILRQVRMPNREIDLEPGQIFLVRDEQGLLGRPDWDTREAHPQVMLALDRYNGEIAARRREPPNPAMLEEIPSDVVSLVHQLESAGQIKEFIDSAIADWRTGVTLSDDLLKMMEVLAYLFGYDSAPGMYIFDSTSSLVKNLLVTEVDQKRIHRHLYDWDNYDSEQEFEDITADIYRMMEKVAGYDINVRTRIKQYGSIIRKLRSTLAKLKSIPLDEVPLDVSEIFDALLAERTAFALKPNEYFDDLLGFNVVIDDTLMDDAQKSEALTDITAQIERLLGEKEGLTTTTIRKQSAVPGYEAVNLFVQGWLNHKDLGPLPVKIQIRFRRALMHEMAMRFAYKVTGQWEYPPWMTKAEVESSNSLEDLREKLFQKFKQYSAQAVPDKPFNVLSHVEVPAGRPYIALDKFAPAANSAMLGEASPDTRGGIDFNPANLDIEKRGSGVDITIPLDGANLENVNIEGFVPVIFSITPITNLPMFLGQTREKKPPVEQLTSL